MANKSLIILAILSIYVDLGISDCPYGIYESGLSNGDRNFIVNQHNYLRGQVASGNVQGQPRATNMKQMKYSYELERKAQEIANKCEFRHETVTGTSWGWVGQNLFISYSTGYGKGSDWNGAINSWYNEHSKYRFGSPFSKDTGHYTQLVWADTDNVGCGYAYFKKAGYWTYQKLYVCNYGPGGNYIGQNPYRT